MGCGVGGGTAGWLTAGIIAAKNRWLAKISITIPYSTCWFRAVNLVEATALGLIEKSAEWITEQLPGSQVAIVEFRKRYDEMTDARWDEIIDFINCIMC